MRCLWTLPKDKVVQSLVVFSSKRNMSPTPDDLSSLTCSNWVSLSIVMNVADKLNADPEVNCIVIVPTATSLQAYDSFF